MDAIEQLNLFTERAGQLAQLRLIRENHLQAKSRVSWDVHDQQIRVETELPDEEELRSYLLTLRQFVSDKEPVFLYRIFNLCQLHITHEAIRRNVAQARQVWRAQMKGQGFQVTLDDVRMTPEHVADLMVNGYYFHSDDNHREELARMLPYGAQITKVLFVDFIVKATEVLFYLDGALRQCFREGHLSPTPIVQADAGRSEIPNPSKP